MGLRVEGLGLKVWGVEFMLTESWSLMLHSPSLNCLQSIVDTLILRRNREFRVCTRRTKRVETVYTNASIDAVGSEKMPMLARSCRHCFGVIGVYTCNPTKLRTIDCGEEGSYSRRIDFCISQL